MEVPRSSFNQKLENCIGKHANFETNDNNQFDEFCVYSVFNTVFSLSDAINNVYFISENSDLFRKRVLG